MFVNMHTHARDGSVYSHDETDGSLFCCCAYLLCLAGVLKARPYRCVRILSTMEMHSQGTSQCIVTHDETGVDLYIVVHIYSV